MLKVLREQIRTEGRSWPWRPDLSWVRPAAWRRVSLVTFATWLGVVLFLGLLAVALLAPQLAPADPWRSVAPPFQAPSEAYPLGTDDLGRDVLSGILFAARTSLAVGLGAAVLSTGIGVVLGAISGYFGGLWDDGLMRLTEFFQAMPRFFLALLAVAMFRPGLLTIGLVLGLTAWPMCTRLLRAQVLSVREREYVIAARALGAGDAHILWKHVLPNALPPVIVHASLMVGQFMLIETSLAFLGLGDPDHISWGYMLQNAQPFLRNAWWMFLFPGLAVALAILCFNLIGDGINDMRRNQLTGR